MFASSTRRLLRKNGGRLINSPEEEDIVEWLRDNPAIYSHGLANLKGREVKQDLMAEMALLDKWITVFRNYYVKLTKSKSGQAPVSLRD